MVKFAQLLKTKHDRDFIVGSMTWSPLSISLQSVHIRICEAGSSVKDTVSSTHPNLIMPMVQLQWYCGGTWNDQFVARKEAMRSMMWAHIWADYLVLKLVWKRWRALHHTHRAFTTIMCCTILLFSSIWCAYNSCCGNNGELCWISRGNVHRCGTKGTFKWKCCSQLGFLMFSLCFFIIA